MIGCPWAFQLNLSVIARSVLCAEAIFPFASMPNDEREDCFAQTARNDFYAAALSTFRAMTIRRISFVPSPINVSRLSR